MYTGKGVRPVMGNCHCIIWCGGVWDYFASVCTCTGWFKSHAAHNVLANFTCW